MYMDELIKQIESREYDWLARSNQHVGPKYYDAINAGKYFANITKNSPGDTLYETYGSYGDTALEAMTKAYNKLTEKNR